MYSKKLARQIKKSFGASSPEEFKSYLMQLIETLNTPEIIQQVEQQFNTFFEAIEKAYAENEERLVMATRSIDLSSEELSGTNQKLSNLNNSMSLMLDALGEGYFLLNSDGLCEGMYSKMCEQIFGAAPTGQLYTKLLRLPENQVDTYNTWLQLIFKNKLSLPNIEDLGPKQFVNQQLQTFKIRFRTISENNKIKYLVVIASNQTAEIQANLLAQTKIIEAKTIQKLAEHKSQFLSFILMIREEFEFFKNTLEKDQDWQKVNFALHTIKGGAATFHMTELEDLVHSLEIQIREDLLRKSKKTVNMNTVTLQIEESIERFITNYQVILGHPKSWLDQIMIDKKIIVDLISFGTKNNISSAFLDNLMLETLGIELGEWFTGFQSTIQVTAKNLNKNVGPLQIRGENLRIYAEPYKKFFSSLVHLFRNAIDHGIESEFEREQLGKPAQGTIKVIYGLLDKARGFWFEVHDDGSGVDCARLKEKLVEKIGPEASGYTDEKVLSALLSHSVSSKTAVDITSGMGVGLAAVGEALSQIKGHHIIKSQPGKGTQFRFEIPFLSWKAFDQTRLEKSA